MNLSKEFKKINVRILTKQLEQLQALAKERTTTYNYLIRIAISKLLEEEAKKAK